MIPAILSKILCRTFANMWIPNGTKIISAWSNIETKQRYEQTIEIKMRGSLKYLSKWHFHSWKEEEEHGPWQKFPSIFQFVDYYSTYAHKRIALSYNESVSLITGNRTPFLALRHVKTASSCTMTRWKLPSIFYENKFWICICRKTCQLQFSISHFVWKKKSWTKFRIVLSLQLAKVNKLNSTNNV